MSTGRTVEHWMRVYADGYDLSGYTRTIGPLDQSFDATPVAALSDAVKNVLAGQGKLSIGTLNGFFDNTATVGLHAVMNGAGVKRTVMIPVGIRAAPAQGDPVFCGEYQQLDYKAVQGDGYVMANIPFGDASAIAAHLAYTKPWGTLLHAKGAETGANSATGVDDNGAASSRGGFLVYQIFGETGNGGANLKVQDAATNANGSFADLSGAETGNLDFTQNAAGIIALATTATVRRFLRWQLDIDDLTTGTFALAFIRG